MELENGEDQEEAGAGMNLSFEPMLMTFTDICYFVDMPAVCNRLEQKAVRQKA